MKKYVLLLVLFAIVAATSAHAQLFGPKSQGKQREPEMLRLYGVDIPQTEEMIFKNVLPSTMKIIGVSTLSGEGRLLLVTTEMYEMIKKQSEEYKEMYKGSKIPPDRFIGMDFLVSPIEKLSLLSNKQIRQLATEKDKELARTLNEYNKYTLIGESPKPVLMMRTKDGKFVPDFNYSPTSAQQQRSVVPSQEESLMEKLFRNRPPRQ